MNFLDTARIVGEGQFKSSSAVQVFWLTRFRGCKIANTLHTPKRNFMGKVSTSKIWILQRPENNQ